MSRKNGIITSLKIYLLWPCTFMTALYMPAWLNFADAFFFFFFFFFLHRFSSFNDAIESSVDDNS